MSERRMPESREATEKPRRADDAHVGRVPFETPPSSTEEDPGDADFPVQVGKDRPRKERPHPS